MEVAFTGSAILKITLWQRNKVSHSRFDVLERKSLACSVSRILKQREKPQGLVYVNICMYDVFIITQHKQTNLQN